MARALDLEPDELSLPADAAAVLGEWPDQEPPADGLERVLTAIAEVRPARPRSEEWLRPVLLSLGGVVAGCLLIYATGARLAQSSPPLPVGALGALSGFGLGALVFFGVGSLVTLALAPALLLELQSQRQRARTR